MNLLAAGLVSASSFLHLGWNTAIRSTSGNLRFVWLLVLTGGLFAAAGTVALGIPWNFGIVWPWVLATITVHSLYFASLAQSYRQGALRDVYPAARGGGILFSIPLALILFHQVPGVYAVAGACLIAVAVIIPSLRSGGNLATLGWVLSVSALIALYSAIDSHSVHFISPWPYISAQYLGTALVLAPWALGHGQSSPAGPAALSGIGSVISYLLVLYAYQRAAVAPVLALRQIAIAFAPFAGWIVLKEPWQVRSMFVSAAIVLGCALIVLR